MPPTVCNLNLDDVLSAMALMCSLETISDSTLEAGIELLIMESRNQWDLNSLVEQVKERAAVLA